MWLTQVHRMKARHKNTHKVSVYVYTRNIVLQSAHLSKCYNTKDGSMKVDQLKCNDVIQRWKNTSHMGGQRANEVFVQAKHTVTSFTTRRIEHFWKPGSRLRNC